MKRDKTNYIVIHSTATRPSQNIGFAEVDQWHKERGWDGCGYHAIIRQSGRIEFGRHFDDVGAHVKGYNRESVGIALVGGLNHVGEPSNTFNQDQLVSMSILVEMLLEVYPAAKVQGHRDFPFVNKECPCFDVREYFDEQHCNR